MFIQFSSDISKNHQMSSLWHDEENIRVTPSLLTRQWMCQANFVQQLAAHVLYLCTLMFGCSVSQKCFSPLRCVSPRPSSFFLYFPCKVWGFSKQTGGDKHMLWTALCWVVSEVQQSRSLASAIHHTQGLTVEQGPCFTLLMIKLWSGPSGSW